MLSDRLSHFAISASLGLVGLLYSTAVVAGSGSYLSSYRPTIEIKYSATSSDILYDSTKRGPRPDNCTDHVKDVSLMSCNLGISQSSGGTYTLGLQQVFKRKGFFYYGADIGGSIFLLDAKAEETSSDVTILQPLQKARVHLYGGNLRAYLQFGITPASILPDLLISVGVGAHLSTGNIKIEGERHNINVATDLQYLMIEAVWWRFGEGSLSSYLSAESGSSFAPKVDFGDYQNLKIHPSQTAIGLIKLVIPWKL